jgi:hypothetical protein
LVVHQKRPNNCRMFGVNLPHTRHCLRHPRPPALSSPLCWPASPIISGRSQ